MTENTRSLGLSNLSDGFFKCIHLAGFNPITAKMTID